MIRASRRARSVEAEQPKHHDDDHDRTDDVQNRVHVSYSKMMSGMNDSVQAKQPKNDDDDHDCANDVEDRVHVTPPCTLTESRMRATGGPSQLRGRHNRRVDRHLNGRYDSAPVPAPDNAGTACSIRRVR